MKLLALTILAASAAAQTVSGVDLTKFDKCLTGCLENMAKSVSCELNKPECYCASNTLNIGTGTYALCVTKECASVDAQVMAASVFGQICTNTIMGGETDVKSVSAAAAPSPSAPASSVDIEDVKSAATAAASAVSSAASVAASAAGAAASPAAKPASGATPLAISALAVGGALAAFLA